MILKAHFILLSKFALGLGVASTILAVDYGGWAIAQALATDLALPAAILMSLMISKKAVSSKLATTQSPVRNKLRQLRTGRK